MVRPRIITFQAIDRGNLQKFGARADENILALEIYSVTYFGACGPSLIPQAEANHAEVEGGRRCRATIGARSSTILVRVRSKCERMLASLQSRNGKNDEGAQPSRKVYSVRRKAPL